AQMVLRTRSMEKLLGHDAPASAAPCMPTRGIAAAVPHYPGLVVARGTAAPRKRPDESVNWVVPGATRVNYTKLELKIISGTPQRRMATINNETFLTGESMRVNLGADRIGVKCLEIRDRSVLVKVAGEEAPRELKLQVWR